MEAITLDKVKYGKCKACGRGFPKATLVLPTREELISKKPHEDKFKAHNNKLCKPCLDIKFA